MRAAKALLSISVLLASTALAPSAGANLLTNPGFETGDLTGWTLTNPDGGGDAVSCSGGSFFAGASEGSCAMLMNGGNVTPDAILEQAFATTLGTTYSLTFDIGKFDPINTPGAASVLVELFDGGVLLAGFPQSAEDTSGAILVLPGNVVGFSATFVATSTLTSLRITDQSANAGFNFDTVLDNFAVVPVPEPGTAALFAAGLLGLGGARGVRRRAARAGAGSPAATR